MTDPHSAPPAAGSARRTLATSPRWLRLALAASVALNLCVAGVVGGALLHDAQKGPKPLPVRELGFGPFSEALSEDDREALRRAFVAQAPDFREARRAMRAEFATILTALRAEPFDPAALQALLGKQNARVAGMLELGQTLIFERVGEMTPEARLAFADRLEASLTRRPDRKSKGPEGGPEGPARD